MPPTFQERGYQHSVRILRFYRTLATTGEIPHQLSGQMLRAGTAIGANLEEAKSAYSRRELASKYAIALKEARECLYWLRLILSDRPGLTEDAAPLVDECHQIIAMLTVTVRKLRAK